MTFEEAHRLLDNIKDGAQYPDEVVDRALSVTGDQLNYIFVATTELDEFVEALFESGAI